MPDTHPTVSVLIAHYNGQHLVEETLQSIVAQDYPHVEIIVADDKSPDPLALDYLKSLQATYAFKLVECPVNGGPAKAFAAAFRACTGDYIAVVAQDDLYLPDKISYCVKQLQTKKADAIYCNIASFKENNSADNVPFETAEVQAIYDAKGEQGVYQLLCEKDELGCLQTQGALFHRKIWDENVTIREQYLLDDWPFSIIAWRDYRVLFDPKVVCHYRIHEGNSHGNYWKWFWARMHVICTIVPEETRVETIGFMLSSLGQNRIRVGETVEGCLLLLCSALLCRDGKYLGIVPIKHRFNKMSKREIDSLKKRVSPLGFMLSSMSLVRRRVMKGASNLILDKSQRARFRHWIAEEL